MVRFDRETDEPLPDEAVAPRCSRALDALIPRVDGAIVEDYGKGVLRRGSCSAG